MSKSRFELSWTESRFSEVPGSLLPSSCCGSSCWVPCASLSRIRITNDMLGQFNPSMPLPWEESICAFSSLDPWNEMCTRELCIDRDKVAFVNRSLYPRQLREKVVAKNLDHDETVCVWLSMDEDWWREWSRFVSTQKEEKKVVKGRAYFCHHWPKREMGPVLR